MDETRRLVELSLDGVRPFIRAHAGDVAVESVTAAGSVRLQFKGACSGCPAAGTTFAAAVLPAVESVPGVTSVSVAGVNISRAALERIRRLATARPANAS